LPTPAEDAADIARLRALLLKRLAEQEVVYFMDIGQLMLEVTPRLRRNGTWAGEQSLAAFFEVHLKEFRIDGPTYKRYVRAPEPSTRRRILNWLTGAPHE
jgi:hypothetical protein